MSEVPQESTGAGEPTSGRTRAAGIHAVRAPTPSACGCGRAVAFDLERHEFFCVGCGAACVCTCRRSAWTSTVRPVNVA